MRKTTSSKNRKDIFVLGAGGHSRSLLNCLKLGGYRVKGFFDDGLRSADEMIGGIPVMGKIKDVPRNVSVVISTGNNVLREKWLKQFGGQVIQDNVMHPLAVVEEGAVLGKHNQLLAGSYVNSFARVGNNNILNTRCVVEHEAVLGDNNHVSVGAIVCGRAAIGNRCMIGAGAVVIDQIKICDDVTVGANAVVVKDITVPGTYVGNPARKIK